MHCAGIVFQRFDETDRRSRVHRAAAFFEQRGRGIRRGVGVKRKQLVITLTPAADEIIKSLADAQNDYDKAFYGGLSEEEIVQYAYLSNKINDNIKRVLQ